MKVFLIIGHLSCGPLMILLMYLFYAFPPQQTNSIYGYRTNRSMQNQEVWRFANNTSEIIRYSNSNPINIMSFVKVSFFYHNSP